jgi:hypothetical protein
MKSLPEPDLRGTWSLPEKRVRKNRENLLRFFTSPDKHGQPRKKVFRVITPKAFITLAQLYLAHRDEIEMIFSYVRKFKQAAGEITEEDVQQTSNEIDVINVMES